MSSAGRNVVGILLAAGRGQRFDPNGQRNKLLQRLGSGIPIAVQAAHSMLDVLPRVVAVTSCDEVAQELRHAGCEVHHCPDAEGGMGSSLAAAMRFVLADQAAPKAMDAQMTDANLITLTNPKVTNAQADAVLIALADMPYIEFETIQAVVDALQRGARIARPYYLGQSGHPVGFSSMHFPALLALAGDKGARDLLRETVRTSEQNAVRNREHAALGLCAVDAMWRVVVPDSGILRDIDYVSDLNSF